MSSEVAAWLVAWQQRTPLARREDVEPLTHVREHRRAALVATSVHESRREEWRRFPSPYLPAGLPVTAAPLATLPAPVLSWAAQESVWARPDSHSVGSCTDCAGGHVRCGSCGGAGQVQRMVRSQGTITTHHRAHTHVHDGHVSYHQPPPTVSTTTTVTPTQVNCASCGGSGRVVHARCNGTGAISTAFVAVVAHDVRTTRAELSRADFSFAPRRVRRRLEEVTVPVDVTGALPPDLAAAAASLHEGSALAQRFEVQTTSLVEARTSDPDQLLVVYAAKGSWRVHSRLTQRRRRLVAAAAAAGAAVAVLLGSEAVAYAHSATTVDEAMRSALNTYDNVDDQTYRTLECHRYVRVLRQERSCDAVVEGKKAVLVLVDDETVEARER